MSFSKKCFLAVGYIMVVNLVNPDRAMAMHIMEGFLPVKWAVFWAVLALPFFLAGISSIKKTVAQNPGLKFLLGLAGAYAFVLSALKIPSVTGSSSHATGVGLGTILFGPCAMTVLGSVVLVFQALLLAHGGITTLGANIFSMAVAGPLVSYWIFRVLKGSGVALKLCVFCAASLGNLVTYLVTSLQLALAFPMQDGGVLASMIKFASIFAFTQIPLAISEGLLTVLIFNLLNTHSLQELKELSQLRKGLWSDKHPKGEKV